MKRLAVIALSVGSLFIPHAAYADHDGGNSGGNYGDNEREEEYGNGSCKYFCPAFDRSPVEDSFNICLPMANCYWDGSGDNREEGPSEGR